MPGSGSGSGGKAEIPDMVEPVDPTTSALDRLTRVQYVRTIEAAFPGLALPAVELPADGTDGIFTSNAPNRLGDFSAYFDAAEKLGAAIAQSLVSKCSWLDETNACVRDELGSALRIGFRRPVTDADQAAVSALLAQLLASDFDSESALSVAIARILLSPDFIFRLEPGVASLENAAGRVLGDHEIAARLSYVLTDAPPDGTLRALADSGELTAPGRLRAEAERLFDGPLGEAIVWRFLTEWLDLDNLPKRPQVADLAPGLVESMLAETRTLANRVLHEDKAPVSELFTASYSYVDRRLADHYGLSGSFGEQPTRFDWSGQQGRSGILTHASVLTALTSSSRSKDVIPRGRVVYTRLLCGELDPPDAALTTEPVEDRTANPRCRGCHNMMDPFGRTFGVYDELGRYGGEPSVPGSVITDYFSGDFTSAADLVEQVVSSDRFPSCMSELAFRAAVGRRLRPDEVDLLASLSSAFSVRGSFRDLLLAVVDSDAFRSRYDPTDGDGCSP
jgi:hypothetical protein